MREKWLAAVLLGLAALFGYILAESDFFSKAQAQASEGQSAGVICVMGQELRGYVPIVLIDTREQRLLVYEYYMPGHSIELEAVRPYMYDRMAPPLRNKGISVEEVRGTIRE